MRPSDFQTTRCLRICKNGIETFMEKDTNALKTGNARPAVELISDFYRLSAHFTEVFSTVFFKSIEQPARSRAAALKQFLFQSQLRIRQIGRFLGKLLLLNLNCGDLRLFRDETLLRKRELTDLARKISSEFFATRKRLIDTQDRREGCVNQTERFLAIEASTR